jgi:NADH:ubiquinone oxidoreductase subunit K
MYFYNLIKSFCVYLVFYIIIAVLAIVEGTVKERTWMLVVVSVEIFLNLVAMGYIIDLIVFHRWLQKHGASTFDYVVFERKKKEKLQQLKNGDEFIDQAEFDLWKNEYFQKV